MTMLAIRSAINTDKFLDENTWGVSVISAQGAIAHQMIIIEGVKDGAYFRNVGELTLDAKGVNNIGNIGYTRYRVFDDEELKKRLVRKTNTLLLAKEKVEALIERLKVENQKDFPFHSFGSKSVVALDADVAVITHPVLEAIQRVDKKLFMCLLKSAKHHGLHVGMTTAQFDNAIKEALRKIKNTVFTGGSDKDKNKTPHRHFNEQDREYEYLSDEDHAKFNEKLTFKDLIAMIREHTGKPKKITAENCATWSENILREYGIEMIVPHPVVPVVDSVISYPKLHVIHQVGKNNPPLKDTDFKQLVYNPSLLVDSSKKSMKGRVVNYDRKRSDTPEEIKNIRDSVPYTTSTIALLATVVSVGTIAYSPMSVLSMPELVPMAINGAKSVYNSLKQRKEQLKDAVATSGIAVYVYAQKRPDKLY